MRSRWPSRRHWGGHAGLGSVCRAAVRVKETKLWCAAPSLAGSGAAKGDSQGQRSSCVTLGPPGGTADLHLSSLSRASVSGSAPSQAPRAKETLKSPTLTSSLGCTQQVQEESGPRANAAPHCTPYPPRSARCPPSLEPKPAEERGSAGLVPAGPQHLLATVTRGASVR